MSQKSGRSIAHESQIVGVSIPNCRVVANAEHERDLRPHILDVAAVQKHVGHGPTDGKHITASQQVDKTTILSFAVAPFPISI